MIGVGNEARGDDAFGLRLVGKMKEARGNCDVEFIEGGTAGLDLLRHFDEAEFLILVDAMDLGLEAGTVLLLDERALLSRFEERMLSLHDVGLPQLIRTAARMGVKPPRLVIVAVQVEQTNQGMELSPQVEAALPMAEELVEKEIAKAKA